MPDVKKIPAEFYVENLKEKKVLSNFRNWDSLFYSFATRVAFFSFAVLFIA